jgi:primosomal protein N' (replication factor Y)
MKILRVALDVPLDTLFDYLAPGEAPSPGTRVVVPFGRRKLVGVVMELGDHSDLPPGKLKPVFAILRDAPPLPEDILHLLRFCADYYRHPLGEAVLNALPTKLRQGESAARKPAWFCLTEAGRQASCERLATRALVQRKLLLALQHAGALDREAIRTLSPSGLQAAKDFVERGWLSMEVSPPSDTPPRPEPTVDYPAPASEPRLTPAQEEAVAALLGQPPGFQPWLLHGITGSGKTEIYLQLIAKALAEGGQVLVLVPEINLTPQLENRFRARFPAARLATLHSQLNPTERLEHWLAAQAGQAGIVLGTRLAVFAPMPRLRLVIVDEEHDSSFKQQDGLRYSARDVAVIRAKQAGVPVLLGSATPALESYYNALQGRYRLLELPQRAVAGATLPKISTVDVRPLKLVEGLSEPLLEALRGRLARGEQSLVFINRRGYAPVIACDQCGWVSTCHRCSSRLVLHLRERRLRCHHCGHEARVPHACPDCGNADLRPLGQGTQRIEAAVASLFPEARILRIDRDSARRKHALPELLRQAHEGEADIIVGTQILAKGHDFQNLTLVGVVDADGALYSGDFRASERLFAQLMQVAGRAGRAAGHGEVLIQTQFPEHPLFAALRRHDYPAFAQALLTEREQAGFPPFCHQALLRAEATRLEPVLDFLARAKAMAERLAHPVTVYDPVPAAMVRLAGKERGQLLVQASSRTSLQRFLRRWCRELDAATARNIRWALDVDPLEF